MPVNIYINFASTPANTHKTWNFTGNLVPGTQEMIADLLDESGGSTGISLWSTAVSSGNSTSGVNSVGSGDAAWVDEATCSKNFQYASSGVTVVREFRALDNAKTYDFELFSSWASTGNRRIEISFDGFSTVAGTLEASNNSSNVISVAGLSPASGVIELSYRPLSGDSFGHCNAIWLQENDAAGGGGTTIAQGLHRIHDSVGPQMSQKLNGFLQ